MADRDVDRLPGEEPYNNSRRSPRPRGDIRGKQIIVYKYLDKLPYAVAFDEAQFFDEGLIDVVSRLANSGVRVICAGLDQDFRGEPFGIMPTLLTKAEYVTKLQGICMVCGAPATRTQRMIDGHPADYDDATIKVGANESYESRCRHCHIVPRKNYE